MQRSRGRCTDMGANGNKDGDGTEPAQYSGRYYRHTVGFRVNEMKRQKKTSFRDQSNVLLQDSTGGGRVLGLIFRYDCILKAGAMQGRDVDEAATVLVPWILDLGSPSKPDIPDVRVQVKLSCLIPRSAPRIQTKSISI